MFNALFNTVLFQSVFAPHTANYVASTCADYITVDAVNGTARVMFNNGSIYNYTNVSRRAIVKFILDDARSLGKFVNNVLTQQRVNCKASLTY